MKRFPFFFLFLCLAFLFLPVQRANAADTPLFAVYPFEKNAAVVTPYFDAHDNMWFLFLPAGTDLQRLRVTTDGSVLLNGTPLVDGETAAFASKEPLTITLQKKNYPLRVLVSKNLPAIFLTTESGSLETIHADKHNKESGTFTLAENGALTLTNAALKQIKGRGNTSWSSEADKRPYNIKFEEPTDLFGFGAAKKWTLLANFFDDSFIGNYLALTLAQWIEIPYAAQCKPVDLYINGNYRGWYLLTESVQVDKERVNITDLDQLNEESNPDENIEELPQSTSFGSQIPLGEKQRGLRRWTEIKNNPAVINGGYLMEMESGMAVFDAPAGFTSNRGQGFSFKTPEYASKAELDYIADFYQEFEDAVASKSGKNNQGKSYLDYIDLNSFVNMFLLQEFTGNFDFSTDSSYLFKPADEEVFYAGPAWDFDQAWYAYDEEAEFPCNIWSIYKNYDGGDRQTIYLFSALFEHEDFRAAVKKRWSEIADHLSTTAQQYAEQMYAEIEAAVTMDCQRWSFQDEEGEISAEEKLESFQKKQNYLADYIPMRIAALTQGIENPESLSYLGEKNDSQSNIQFLWIVLGGIGITATALAIIVVIKKQRRNKSSKNAL